MVLLNLAGYVTHFSKATHEAFYSKIAQDFHILRTEHIKYLVRKIRSKRQPLKIHVSGKYTYDMSKPLEFLHTVLDIC